MVDSDHDYAQVVGNTVGRAAGLTVVQAMADSRQAALMAAWLTVIMIAPSPFPWQSCFMS
jgi:hypothetical protein